MIGFLCVNKPKDLTSQDVVYKIKKKFGIKKIGHMGTLDPMATGVLPIAIGKATRCFDYFLDKVKTYIVEFEFGYETDTLDITGNILSRNDFVPEENKILSAMEHLTGKYNQTPPKYSAKNVGGVRAYDLARAGVEFSLSPKMVEISKFDSLEKVNCTTYRATVTCGSGTYIRSLVRDLGALCNSFATMSKLTRVESGAFNIENAVNLDSLLGENDIEKFIIDISSVFPKFGSYYCSDEECKALINGMTKIVNLEDGNTFLYHDESLLGISKVKNSHIKLDTFLM